MQLSLGTKIRELRQRDGRTQDDIAEALGVTAQAVSRWELETTYPDMEMIPKIANYFHISIDRLFGYEDNRDEKIRSILDSASKTITKQGFVMSKGSLTDDVYDCINMLRDAAEEFPSEPKILLKLAQALVMWGWHIYGARALDLDESGVYREDTAYNAQNEYWQEAVRVYEKILKCNPSPEDKEGTIPQVINLYSRMGEYKKAKLLVMQQNPVRISKEVLLPNATVGDEKVKSEANRILSLLGCLNDAIQISLAMRPALTSSQDGKQLYLSIVRMYESIFSDGRCGCWHTHICLLYMWIVYYEDSTEMAMKYFDKAFDHYKEYQRIYNSIEQGEEYTYSAPLVSALKIGKGELAPFAVDFWKHELNPLKQDILNNIRKNPKYAECFE